MTTTPRDVTRTYILITLSSTLASSLIWGVNTLFLLDAGLSNTEAFAANAFFTLGQMLFEVPTGVVADTWGRRASFLLGAGTLFISTALYLLMWMIEAPLIGWALSSAVIGLGFTFFSGAVEAWLVDALDATKFKGTLESILAKGQITAGISMLTGSILGGVIAQYSNLGVPYVLRAILLAGAFILAYKLMFDIGFTPAKKTGLVSEMKTIVASSIKHGLKNPATRWVMLSSPFSGAVGIYAFYAMQPYLLELYGDPTAYSIAGLAAAIIAGAQVAGGLLVPHIRKVFKKRTSVLATALLFSAFALAIIGIFDNFWVAVGMLILWAMAFAASMPVRSAYLNKLIPSSQRATALSFDALLGSGGAAVSQPLLGRAADVWSYATSYLIVSVIQLLALPFVLLARREAHEADTIDAIN